MKKMTAAIFMLFTLSSQAADLNRCFTHSDGEKGLITISKTSISVDWFVQFYSNGEHKFTATSQGSQVDIDWEKNIGSSKIVAGNALLLGIIDYQRSDLDEQLYPKVIVTVDEKFVSFEVPTYKHLSIESLKYPIVPCR
jgi:hypothetical protein